MSNLSELLPAGGAAKEFEPVASGTLPNGQAVILKANGQVEAVAASGSAFSKGSASVFDTNNPTEGLSVVYDSLNDKIVVVYSDSGNSSYGTAIVGTVSGTSISFGTAVVFNSGNTQKVSAVFDSNSNKVIPVWNQVIGTSLMAIVGTVSGTGISFGSSVTFSSDSANYINSTFDSNSNKVVIAYMDSGNSDHGSAIVGTVSGTSISFGSVTVFESFQTEHIGMTFDSNLNKVVIGFQRSNKGYGIVGTVSGTGISFGTKVTTDGSNTSRYFSLTFDTTNNKVVFGYISVPNAEAVAAVVGTVSGTAISFGTPTILISGGIDNYRVYGATYDSTANKVCFSSKRESNNFIDITSASVSGTTLVSISSNSLDVPTASFAPIVYDPDTNTVVCVYQDTGNSSRGTAIVSTTDTFSTNLASTNFVGITAEAITSGATGVVVPQGGVATNLSSLTIGSEYYVQANGTVSTVSTSPAVNIGKAISATSLILKG